jgi:excreted virulence factor EspC (type VII ESX diderm)
MIAPALHRNRDGFTVDPDALGTRADQVDALADRLHRAASGPLLLDDGSFGLVGTAFGSTAAQATVALDTSIDDFGLVVREVAEDLRDCRHGYSDEDGSAADRFTTIAMSCHGTGPS